MNIPNKIIDLCHKEGLRFSFDKDCMVLNCKKLAVWDQDITHQLEGKIKLELCDKHMKDFDENKSFRIEMSKNERKVL